MSTHAEAMPQSAQTVSRIIVSTDALPEGDRARLIREELSKVLNLDITPLGEGVPRQRMDYVAAGPVGFSLLDGSPSRVVRSRRHLPDCDENFLFGLFLGGWDNPQPQWPLVHAWARERGS